MAYKSIAWTALAAALVAIAAPVPAQYMSSGYEFFKAIKAGELDKAMAMVSEPGTVLVNTKDSSSGETALHMMTRSRSLGWIGYLINKGAKPDIQNRDGMTPLAIAAQLGWIDGADRLLRARAQVDLPNKFGETPLILAVQNRNMEMARLLLSKGANPKRGDTISGSSALDYARKDGRSEALVKLLETPPATATARPVAGPGL